MFKKLKAILAIILFELGTMPVVAQQPQTSDLPPLTPPFTVDATTVNGVAPGYKPSAASTGLTLNLSAGTAWCGSIIPYPGGTLVMTDNTTNYVYLDMNNSCSPTASTSVYTGTQIPLATVVTSGGKITTITDVRTSFSKSQVGPIQQTNGVSNTTQTKLNLVQGQNINISSDSNGNTTIGNSFTVKHNGSTVGVSQLGIDFDDSTPAAPSGSAQVIFQTNGSGKFSAYTNINLGNNLSPAVVPPVSGQYVFVPATTHTIVVNNGTVTASNTSTTMTLGTGGPFEIDDTVTFTNYQLPAGIPAANVTAIYGVAISSQTNFYQPPSGGMIATLGCSGINLAGNNFVGGWGAQQVTALTSFTGSTIGSITCQAHIGANNSGGGNMIVSTIGLIVYYTGSPVASSNNVLVQLPLFFNVDTNAFGIYLPNDAASDTGSVNAYAASILNFGLIKGATIKVNIAHNNTSGTPTFAFNGSTANTIIGPTGLPLVAGDLNTTVPAILLWDGTNFELQNPQVSGVGQFVVSALPTCSSSYKSLRLFVTDASSPTFLGTLTGGGSTFAPVVCNGTAFVSY